MTNTILLKQLLIGKNLTQAKIANELGLSEQSFNQKINNKREFKVSEISKLIQILEIKDPMSVFFAINVDCKSTRPQIA